MSETDIALRANKNAGIIEALCQLYDISIKEATDIYYSSETSRLIEEGVAELHCRSEKYLASLVWDEYLENHTAPYIAIKQQ